MSVAVGTYPEGLQCYVQKRFPARCSRSSGGGGAVVGGFIEGITEQRQVQ